MKTTIQLAVRVCLCVLALAGFHLSASAQNPFLLNVDIQGANPKASLKTGFAAIGISSSDFWNYYTRDNGSALLIVQAANSPVAIEPMPGLLHADQKDGHTHLVFVGIPGQQYTIEASTNLVDWTPTGVATDLSGGVFEFVDAAWTNVNQCFYRITNP